MHDFEIEYSVLCTVFRARREYRLNTVYSRIQGPPPPPPGVCVLSPYSAKEGTFTRPSVMLNAKDMAPAEWAHGLEPSEPWTRCALETASEPDLT